MTINCEIDRLQVSSSRSASGATWEWPSFKCFPTKPKQALVNPK